MKVLIVASLARSLLNFRRTLIESLRAAGHTVVACAAGIEPEVRDGLDRLGVTYHEIALDRRSRNPLRDLRYCLQLRALIAREQPTLVFAYTMKPVVYASLATVGRPRPRLFALITGLGYAFGTGPAGQSSTGVMLQRLLHASLRRNDGLIFQNGDDQALFRRLNLIDSIPSIVVRGSGIDLTRFRAVDIPPGPPRFLLLARMLRAKGVELFAQAARRIKAEMPDARFVLAGAIERGPDAVPLGTLEAWTRAGDIEYLGRLRDVREELARCTTYVLPSYYREGTPRSVLEAMGTGRPIITTDAPGCRDTIFQASAADNDNVRTGLNGLLIPPRSLDPLIVAMRRLARDPILSATLGAESRRLATEYYDVHQIDRQMMEFMDLAHCA